MSDELRRLLAREPWDRIRIRPPICYFPPIWEIVLDREIGQLAKDIVSDDPVPVLEAIEKHLNERIKIVNQLIETKKLDAKIGKIATNHFQNHLRELEALRTRR